MLRDKEIPAQSNKHTRKPPPNSGKKPTPKIKESDIIFKLPPGKKNKTKKSRVLQDTSKYCVMNENKEVLF